ncbi:MAG: prepilin-type N-terminal cleavage/methylation domain-containing protein [Candidatus Omnitrophica bacterium]|nr:prepilin-type N-terminal cleavage/methylation domain-containing protein [Candidatus Omnitrophota bacterium]
MKIKKNDKNATCTYRIQRHVGFTLVEMMVTVVIFSVMMAMVMAVISTANTTYFSADARIVGQEDLRKALRVMIHELAESNRFRVSIPAGNASQITFQIPILVVDGGSLNGQTVDDKNNIIFGARSLPTTVPDGTQNYALRYLLQPNNDVSNSNSLIRQVLDSYPAGNQVGNDLIIANYIEAINFSQNGQTLSIAVTTVKHNKFARNIRTSGIFGVTLRN